MIKDLNQQFSPFKSSKATLFQPRKAGTKTAHVIFILDDSGSMQSCRAGTIDGFNEFLDGQKASEVPTYVSLYKFDGRYVNRVFNRVGVHDVQPLNMETYNPQGSTNLNDAMGEVIVETNNQLAAIQDSVTIVILTDGYENASRTYTSSDVKQMVEKTEAADWGFFFLGANIDAFAVGSNYGFGHANTLQYSTQKMGETMMAATRSVNMMKGARAAGLDVSASYAAAAFTDEDRTKAI